MKELEEFLRFKNKVWEVVPELGPSFGGIVDSKKGRGI
jgi:hypothetical protein